MAYDEIGLGQQANDNLGDTGRQGGAKINAMFRQLYEQTFVNLAGVRVERFVTDVGIEDLQPYRVDDKCSRWVDMVAKDHWVEGIVKQLPFDFENDYNDPTKFFITNEKKASGL